MAVGSRLCRPIKQRFMLAATGHFPWAPPPSPAVSLQLLPLCGPPGGLAGAWLPHSLTTDAQRAFVAAAAAGAAGASGVPFAADLVMLLLLASQAHVVAAAAWQRRMSVPRVSTCTQLYPFSPGRTRLGRGASSALAHHHPVVLYTCSPCRRCHRCLHACRGRFGLRLGASLCRRERHGGEAFGC